MDFRNAVLAWCHEDSLNAVGQEGVNQGRDLVLSFVRTSEEDCESVFVGDVFDMS